MYPLFKKIFFRIDPEKAHYIALQSLQVAYWTGLTAFFPKIPHNSRHVMGLSFPNPIGLAAGLDKNGDYIDALAALGFGFIEIGTVTPKPQAGNPRPRLFRPTEQEAIINRMGFNSKGVEHVVQRLEKTRYRGVLGINIGKNKDTPLDHAIDDYLFGFRHLWRYASYITINISSPNTSGLRDLQQGSYLQPLLATLKQEQKTLVEKEKKYVPLVVKISPDLSRKELEEIADVFLQQHIDGVIATNTTLARDGVENSPYAQEAGGLSGRPLCVRSTNIIKQLHAILQDKIPIIASGGVMDVSSAQEKIAAGAALLQIYSGFIYKGPRLIRELNPMQCMRD